MTTQRNKLLVRKGGYVKALRFTKYGRDGIEHDITVYGSKMDGFILENALKVGWKFNDSELVEVGDVRES